MLLTFTCSKSRIFTHFCSVSIAEFEQVNVSWVKYSICHLHLKSQQKHTRATCQTYSKLVIDTPEQHPVLLLLTLTYFALYSIVNITEIE